MRGVYDMQRESSSEFSGVAGRLLTGSISGGSLVSGLVLGLGLLAVDAVLAFANANAMIMPFNLVVLSFVLARFAVNGLLGEWSGTIFSAAGGPWTVVGTVALRYMALTFLWYMPLALIGLKVAQPPTGAPMTMTHPATGARVESTTMAAPSSAPTPVPTEDGTTRRPLNDAKAQVDAAVRGFAQDPEGALSALRELNDEFAHHPLVLQSLALHAYRAGQVETSIEVAREAIPLCFERGHSHSAAELFREMRQQRSHLALTLEQLLTIGHTLVRMEDYATAAKVYRCLLQHCSGSPLAEYM
jgi:hypothetical protein